jgi:hypothetical protein
MTKHVSIAVLAGFGTSVILAVAIFATHRGYLLLPQYIGFVTCMALRGIRTSSRMDFVEIAIPINAVVYSLFFLLLLRAFRRSRKGSRPTLRKHLGMALIAGPVASAALYAASKAPHCSPLLLPQYVGWWVSVTMGNIDPPNTQDFLEIAGPINAAVYSLFIFLLLRAFRRSEIDPSAQPYERTFGTRSALRAPAKR